MIGKIRKYYREGNLALALKLKLNIYFDKWIAASEKQKLGSKFVNRFYVRNEAEAVRFFFLHAQSWRNHFKEKRKIVVIGNSENANLKELILQLESEGLEPIRISFQELTSLKSREKEAGEFLGIFSFYFRNKINYKISDFLFSSEILKDIPFDYLGDTWEDFEFAREQDHQNSLGFVSPLLNDETDYFELYKRSLTRFEKKCDIRDYMDLCQIIKYINQHEIPGDVAEFGSYKGHSGFLLSLLLEAYGNTKKLFMYDTFKKFPVETIGVDAFWSDTHEVNFEEVKAKFTDRKNVELVKGDFTETLSTVRPAQLSFIYVDCDSYRATTFLMKELYDTVLSSGGVMILEDYGHPALLGNRLAYHHFFDGRKDCFKFFSQFSGFMIIVKK
ncbi:MAG: class I SAM-dependent methyltransferase [Bacteroidetes bacterium]|nr:class I SAM-dependent methyltransferase [Bacteroidota bacterium]